MESRGWRHAALAILCGVFVGSQINESIRVINIYHEMVSKLDAAADMPQYSHDAKRELEPVSPSADSQPPAESDDTSEESDQSDTAATVVNSSAVPAILSPVVENLLLKPPPDVANLLLNPPPTNNTMNACLFIMDDTIRLTEWLAYHYTVLPLGHLVVAIDPKSKRIDKIDKILDMWREYITIDA